MCLPRCEASAHSLKHKFDEDVWSDIFRHYRFSNPFVSREKLGRKCVVHLFGTLGVGGVSRKLGKDQTFRKSGGVPGVQMAAEERCNVSYPQTEPSAFQSLENISTVQHFQWFHDIAEDVPVGHASAQEELSHTPGSVKKATVVLVGDRKVGVSSISDVFTRNLFPLSPSKHEIRLRSCYMRLNASCQQQCEEDLCNVQTVKLCVTEKRGSARRTPFSWKLYDGSATAVIIVFDVTRRSTLSGVDKHLREVLSARRSVPLVMVGSKTDVCDKERQVSFAEAAEFAAARGLLYCEVSALEHHNIELPFSLAVAALARSNGWIQNCSREYEQTRLLGSLKLRQWLSEEDS